MIILQRGSIVSGVLAVDIHSLAKLRLNTVKHCQRLKLSAALAQTLLSEFCHLC